MGGGEVGNLVRVGEVPGSICKSVPPDILFRPGNVDTAVVVVCPARNPHCWDPLFATGGVI